MKTLQQNKGLVSLLVVLSFGWSGLYLAQWLIREMVVREIFINTAIFFATLTVLAYEIYTRIASWNEDRATRPQQTRKANN